MPFYRWDILPLFHRSTAHDPAGIAIIAALWGIVLFWQKLLKAPFLGATLQAISRAVTVGAGILIIAGPLYLIYGRG